MTKKSRNEVTKICDEPGIQNMQMQPAVEQFFSLLP